MRFSASKAMKPNKQAAKQSRATLNKQIAAAPTLAERREIAGWGGKPPTEIQMLVTMVNGNRSFVNPEKSAIQERARLKARFADLLFPALIKDNPAPFNELLEAMAKERRELTTAKDGVLVYGKRPKPPAKKELGRRLRQAVLSLKPDDLISMRAVEAHLAIWEVSYSDESHLRRVMRELNVKLLKPGDTVYFRFGEKCVRKFTVGENGKITNFGMSRQDYDALNGLKAHAVVPAPPDK